MTMVSHEHTYEIPEGLETYLHKSNAVALDNEC